MAKQFNLAFASLLVAVSAQAATKDIEANSQIGETSQTAEGQKINQEVLQAGRDEILKEELIIRTREGICVKITKELSWMKTEGPGYFLQLPVRETKKTKIDCPVLVER